MIAFSLVINVPFYIPVAHWFGFTHFFCTSSSTVPMGHWQPTTHCFVQTTGPGFLHVGGHAVPHLVNTCPLMVHFSAYESEE